MSLANIKKGDTVWHVDFGWRAKDQVRMAEREVTAAGPKYISTGRSRFHRNGGALVTDYSPREWIYATREEWEAEKRREDLIDRAERVVRGFRLRDLSDDALLKLIDLMNEARA